MTSDLRQILVNYKSESLTPLTVDVEPYPMAISESLNCC